MKITKQGIDAMETRYRARFINSLSGFKSANLVGTVDKLGNENLSIVSSVFHLGANPPLMGFVNRPSSVERHTLENILATQVFTINSVSSDFVTKAHQTSARYPKECSEFAQTDLSKYYSNDFPAPYVLESPLRIGLRLVEHHTMDVNQTELIVGEICEIHVEETAVQPDGYVDVESLDLVAVTGLDSYHVTQRLGRLSYAKPDAPLYPLTKEGDPTSWKAFSNHYDED